MDAGVPLDATGAEQPVRLLVNVPAAVQEDVPFEITVTALGANGRPTPALFGDIELFSERGDVRPRSLSVASAPDGSVRANVRLNREGATRIHASLADGGVGGTSGTIRVQHGTWLTHGERAVLDRGFTGSWDDRDVREPSVVAVPADGDHDLAGKLVMFYRGRNASLVETGIGIASSDDGWSWQRDEDSPVLPSEDLGQGRFVDYSEPAVLYDGAIFRMWLTGTTELTTYILHTSSSDARSWTEEPLPVIEPSGGSGWAELWVFSPTVISTAQGYEAWYGAFTPAAQYGIGHASSDGGLVWAKPRENPVLSPSLNAWDEDAVDKPTVLKDGSIYRMWYTGDKIRDEATTDEWSIGYATSEDGIHWEKSPDNPVFSASQLAGRFDRYRVANPTVIALPDPDFPGQQRLRMYFDAFDGQRWRIGAAERSVEGP